MNKRPLPPGTKLHSENAKKVFSGARFDVYQWNQKRFDGSESIYEVVKRNDSVIVLPIIGNEAVLVHEQQPHWDKPGTAIVAGMVEPKEGLAEAAKRELEEETGLIFETFHLVHIEELVPGVEWFAYTFIATGYKGQKEKKLDPGERNEVFRVTFDKLVDMTKKREFHYRPKFIEDTIFEGGTEKFKDVLKNPSKYSIPL